MWYKGARWEFRECNLAAHLQVSKNVYSVVTNCYPKTPHTGDHSNCADNSTNTKKTKKEKRKENWITKIRKRKKHHKEEEKTERKKYIKKTKQRDKRYHTASCRPLPGMKTTLGTVWAVWRPALHFLAEGRLPQEKCPQGNPAWGPTVKAGSRAAQLSEGGEVLGHRSGLAELWSSSPNVINTNETWAVW